MPKKSKVECNKEIHPVDRETLEKASCLSLWKKMGCFAQGNEYELNGKKRYTVIIPHFPNDPTSDTPLGRTFTDLIEVIDKRKCKIPKKDIF